MHFDAMRKDITWQLLRHHITNMTVVTRKKQKECYIVMYVQRSRGGVQHATLNDAERAAKHAILAATPAYMLKDLDELASTLSQFQIFVPRGGGSKDTVQVHIRIGLFCGDYEEQAVIFGIKGHACPRCSFLVTAVQEEEAAGRSSKADRRPYMRTTDSCMCGTAEPRTASSVNRLQADLVTRSDEGAG